MWVSDPRYYKQKHFRALMSMLLGLNIGSFLAAVNLVVSLNPEDRISIKRGGALTLLGFVYFMTLFEVLTMLAMCTGVGARFRRKYALSCGEILDIINKVVSAVQAAFCCVTGAVVCLWSCTRDFMRASHYMSEAYAWFGAAYFFYDIWSMYLVHLEMNTKENVNYIKSKIQRAKNGAAALSAGDAARGRKLPGASFLEYCKHEPVILMHHLFIGGFGFLVIVAIKSLPTGCKISICILLMPQLYWFYLMSAGALKLFFTRKPAAAADKVGAPLAAPADTVGALPAADADKRS